jgi:DNA-binding response OmpR family regulator
LENKILIVEDENKSLSDRIYNCLVERGYQVAIATDIRDTYTMINEFQPELIVLGKVTPQDIYQVCDQLRRTADALIMMIGAVGGGEAWLKSVDAGADFYLVHPFSYAEFGARVKALLRRHNGYSKEREIAETIKL